MSFVKQSTDYILSPAAVDDVSAQVSSVCSDFGVEKKTAQRYRLSVEESLLTWLAQLGEGAELCFSTERRMGRPCFRISAKGERCNPYNVNEEDYGVYGKNVLADIGLMPKFGYNNGWNYLQYSIERKPMNQMLQLLLVIVSAVAIGLIGKQWIPADTLLFLTDDVITPVYDAFFRILSCIAGPMIFLSVAWGVYGIGDVYTLGRVGKKLMLRFVGIAFCFAAAGCFFYPLLGRALSETSAGTSQLGKIFNMILDIFPTNVFSPFVSGNTLQIIFLAFVLGLSLIFLGQQTSSVARAIEQVNQIINFLMKFIAKMVPYFVFVVMVQMIWSGALSTFKSVWKFALVYLGVYALLLIAFLLYTARKQGMSPLLLMRKCLPSYLIGLTTASSAACFESNMGICQRRLGVKSSLASFGVPFGMVMFKPTTALFYLLFCFYLGGVYGVQASLSWVFVALIVATISAVATPPIPGGAAAAYTIMFLQLGISSGALAIALSVDLIFDFVLTSGDMMLLCCELANVAKDIGMQDPDAPKAPIPA